MFEDFRSENSHIVLTGLISYVHGKLNKLPRFSADSVQSPTRIFNIIDNFDEFVIIMWENSMTRAPTDEKGKSSKWN